MAIDGNFAGGFAQGTQPITEGLRQDRRDAAQRAFRQKLITEDRTAQSNIRKENQEIRADENFINRIFALQKDKRQQDRFLIEQGVGRSLQDSQRNNALLSDAKVKTLNNANRLQLSQQAELRKRQEAFAKNLAPTPQQTQQFQAEMQQLQESFGKSLRQAHREANDANAAFNRGQARLGQLQESFQGAVSESEGRSSLQNILSSPGGQAIKNTFGRDDDRIAQLFGQMGEPTTSSSGLGAFGVAPAAEAPFEVPIDTPEMALQKETDVLKLAENTKQLAKQSPGNALRSAGSLAIDSASPESAANNEIRKAFDDIGNKLSTVVNKPINKDLDQVDVDALTVLFKNVNSLSDEDLGNFALARQQEKPIGSGSGLQAAFATNVLGSKQLEGRIKKLNKRIETTNEGINKSFFARIEEKEFIPTNKDSLGELIKKQNAWIEAGKPIRGIGSGKFGTETKVIENEFRDAIQRKTQAVQQQNLLDEIQTFKQRLVQ